MPFFGHWDSSALARGLYTKSKNAKTGKDSVTGMAEPNHIRIDLDSQNFSFDYVLSRAAMKLTGHEYYICSSTTSNQKDLKWRVIIPLLKPMPDVASWTALSLHMARWFASDGDYDASVRGITQGIYTPSDYHCDGSYQYYIASDVDKSVTLVDPKTFLSTGEYVSACTLRDTLVSSDVKAAPRTFDDLSPAEQSRFNAFKEVDGLPYGYWLNEINRGDILPILDIMVARKLITEHSRGYMYGNPAGSSANGLKVVTQYVEFEGNDYEHSKLINFADTDFSLAIEGCTINDYQRDTISQHQSFSIADLTRLVLGTSVQKQLSVIDPKSKDKQNVINRLNATEVFSTNTGTGLSITDQGTQIQLGKTIIRVSTDDALNLINFSDDEWSTDSSLSLAMIDSCFNENIRWIESGSYLGCSWIVWNGIVWEPVSTSKIRDLIHKLLVQIKEVYQAITSPKIDRINDDKERAAKRKSMISTSRQLLSANKIDQVFKLISKSSDITIELNQLNTSACNHLIGCPDGVIDLRVGRVVPGCRGDYLTHTIQYAPKSVQMDTDRKSDQNLWLNYMESVLVVEDENGAVTPDYERINYMQLIAGYALTGRSDQERAFYLYGDGNNGKSVFIKSLETLFGTCAKGLKKGVIVKNRSGNEPHTQSIARLHESRLATIPEGEVAGSLDTTAIKMLSSKDSITANFMNQNDFTFEPHFTTIIAANRLLPIYAADGGIERRVCPISFGEDVKVKLPKQGLKPDSQITDKLIHPDNIHQLLNWVIEGAARPYEEGGFPSPDWITRVQKAWVHGNDDVMDFSDDHVIKASRTNVTHEYAALSHCYERFAKYVRDNRSDDHAKVPTKKEFKTRMEKLGIEWIRSSSGQRGQRDYFMKDAFVSNEFGLDAFSNLN